MNMKFSAKVSESTSYRAPPNLPQSLAMRDKILQAVWCTHRLSSRGSLWPTG